MKLRLALPLAATIALAAPAAAFASNVYDARTLGMGGNSVGYAGNASLAYWNPAAAAMDQHFGVYLPTFAFSLSNNLLGVGDATSLVSSLRSIGQSSSSSGGSNFSSVLKNLEGGQGLGLEAEAMVEPIGYSVGKVGPGNVAVRLDMHSLAFARATLTETTASGKAASGNTSLSSNLNGLFFQGGLTQITNTVQKITTDASNSSNQSALSADVNTLKSQLGQYMSSFIKQNSADDTVKKFNLDGGVGADGALAATYAQPIPLKIAALPESELTVGATGKIFLAPQLTGIMAPVAVPGASNNASLTMLGSGVGADVALNIDKQATDLSNAIAAFQQDQNLATTADLAAKTAAFMNDGLANSTIAFSNTVPNSNVGVGMDFGAAFRLNHQWTFGAALNNPVLLWGATKTTYTYDFSGSAIAVHSKSESTNNWEEEPMVARLGASYQPDFASPLAKGLLLQAGLDAPIVGGFGPSVSLGAEKLFGPVALRLGTEQGGLTPLYTAGLGLQTSAFQLNLGGGVDNPADLKSAALALSLGAGF
ncbi:MAG TPA: hypothetical protein V6D47_17315 [Oscillatoriaceae cyanobacterium]